MQWSQIIRGGFNISAQEVENILPGHSGIVDVAAVAMPMGEKTCVDELTSSL